MLVKKEVYVVVYDYFTPEKTYYDMAEKIEVDDIGDLYAYIDLLEMTDAYNIRIRYQEDNYYFRMGAAEE